MSGKSATPEQAKRMRDAQAKKRAAARAVAAAGAAGESENTTEAGTSMPAASLQAKKSPSVFDEYRNGPDGFIKWANEHLCVNVAPPGSDMERWIPLGELPTEPDPVTGRSYQQMWEHQQEVIRKALVMVHGRFKHRLIILCWPRGEGKTYLNCYILLWRFFCWPSQKWYLCATSKDQTELLQFTTIREIIENSPKLLRMIGSKNIQEKKIRLKDKQNRSVSLIRCISSFSGIVSNASGYAFTEFFEASDPKFKRFFTKLKASIRNKTNALGLIDSTVSSKDHMLYTLYNAYKEGKDKTLFFNYRYSKTGVHTDYWHPLQTQEQLDSERITDMFGSFGRQFLNLWSHGSERIFTSEQVGAVSYLGADCSFRNHARVVELLTERRRQIDEEKRMGNVGNTSRMVADIDSRLIPVSSVYSLAGGGFPSLASADALEKLGDAFDTDWVILAGMDRADPLKQMDRSVDIEKNDSEDQVDDDDGDGEIKKKTRQRSAARTILTVLAKGLPGSRSNPSLGALSEPSITSGPDGKPVLTSVSFIYFLIHLANIEDHSMGRIKAELAQINQEYDGIDKFTAEKYAAADVVAWAADELDLKIETVSPAYGLQLASFTELYTIVDSGRFKSPEILVRGSREDDLLREEMLMFDHDRDKKWFGSPEKKARYGVQDDVVYSIAWAIYGGRALSVKDFRSRGSQQYWGTMVQPRDMVGSW